MARVSALNLAAYRRFMQPLVRAMASQPMADIAAALNPLRLSYTMFSDRNPLMKGVRTLAAGVSAARRPVAGDNPVLALQSLMSDQITTVLNAYRNARDQMQERMFFGVYGSPVVQAMVGLTPDSTVRPVPAPNPETLAAEKVQAASYAAALRTGGFNEALTRAVLYVTANDSSLDQRCALALNCARQDLMHLSLAAFKTMVREQSAILNLGREQAVTALATMLPDADDRKALLNKLGAIVGSGGVLTAVESTGIGRIAKLLAVRAASAERSPAALPG